MEWQICLPKLTPPLSAPLSTWHTADSQSCVVFTCSAAHLDGLWHGGTACRPWAGGLDALTAGGLPEMQIGCLGRKGARDGFQCLTSSYNMFNAQFWWTTSPTCYTFRPKSVDEKVCLACVSLPFVWSVRPGFSGPGLCFMWRIQAAALWVLLLIWRAKLCLCFHLLSLLCVIINETKFTEECVFWFLFKKKKKKNLCVFWGYFICVMWRHFVSFVFLQMEIEEKDAKLVTACLSLEKIQQELNVLSDCMNHLACMHHS